jgi:hypothetical protein
VRGDLHVVVHETLCYWLSLNRAAAGEWEDEGSLRMVKRRRHLDLVHRLMSDKKLSQLG